MITTGRHAHRARTSDALFPCTIDPRRSSSSPP
jgi:hypothetical protein